MTTHWLVKNNPDDFSIEDLADTDTVAWVGVRNHEARNNMQEMSVGDPVLYYHSSASPSGVAGVARVATGAYPDHTAFDPDHRYHDPDSDHDDPTWYMVDLEHVETFDRLVPLSEIKEDPAFDEMPLVNRPRLSVQPVEEDHFERIRKMGRG